MVIITQFLYYEDGVEKATCSLLADFDLWVRVERWGGGGCGALTDFCLVSSSLIKSLSFAVFVAASSPSKHYITPQAHWFIYTCTWFSLHHLLKLSHNNYCLCLERCVHVLWYTGDAIKCCPEYLLLYWWCLVSLIFCSNNILNQILINSLESVSI